MKPSLIHFLSSNGSMYPLCRDGSHATNWTTQRNVVTCPVCLRLLDSSAPRSSRRHNRAAQFVVIVDDDEDTVATLAYVLEGDGHCVRVALNGKAAIEAVREARPDVVVCDIGLPGIDGYEVARILRKQLRFTGLLVAFTGYASAKDRERALAAGFDVHLPKPADAQQVIEIVRSASSGPASSTA